MNIQITRQESAAIVHSVRWALFGGVVLGGILMTIGLVLAFTQHVERPDVDSLSLRDAILKATQGNPLGMLYGGLAVLMLTPVARVVILVVGWFVEREFHFALVALCVFLLLCLSLLLGTG